MSVIIVLVVLCTAIVVFFAQEFARLFKKIAAIPGVMLLVPLAFASWVVEYYEDWGLWLLLLFKNGLHQLIHWLDEHLPPQLVAVSFSHILQLCLLAGLPVWILLVVAKSRKRYEPWPYTYQIGTALWIVGAILLTVHQP